MAKVNTPPLGAPKSVEEIRENGMRQIGTSGLWRKKLFVGCESAEIAARFFGAVKATVGKYAQLDGSLIVIDADDEEQFAIYIKSCWDHVTECESPDGKKMPVWRFVRE